MTLVPSTIPNLIGGTEQPAAGGEWLDKHDPNNGQILTRLARSHPEDVRAAVDSAQAAFGVWSGMPAVERGLILHRLVVEMEKERSDIARIVSAETGKSPRDALAETGGAIQCGLFFASEAQRLYGRTTTSAVPDKYAMTVRQPIGVAGLIIAANTPIANAAWKIFPALVCGNTAVLKAAEDAPATAWMMGVLGKRIGLPDGVLNIVQGLGEEAGAALVAQPEVGVISFTGSTEVGRLIQQAAGPRFARISLELGGKNPLVVCDDADLENAAKWVVQSAFSNAGQRCASTSRVIVFESVYGAFRDMLVRRAEAMRVGPTDRDDFGPLINEGQLESVLAAIQDALQKGASVLTAGARLVDAAHAAGYYMGPTLIENVSPSDEISRRELFGPVALLHRVRSFQDALALANDSPYGLTAAIHTRSIHRALRFCDRVQAGVAVVNAGTYGSEPHMPFGGRKQSGNGSREPGTEAIDVYSELKDIYLNVDPEML